MLGLNLKGAVESLPDLPTSGVEVGDCYTQDSQIYCWDGGTWRSIGSSDGLVKRLMVTDIRYKWLTAQNVWLPEELVAAINDWAALTDEDMAFIRAVWEREYKYIVDILEGGT